MADGDTLDAYERSPDFARPPPVEAAGYTYVGRPNWDLLPAITPP